MTQIDINSQQTDALSTAAHELLAIDRPTAYARLVVRGDGNRQAADRLRNLTAKELLVRPVVSQSDADALLASLWLWHDWLDSSHTISQGITTATGSFWHAIMHRREGDFGNSKYWYARCATHPVLKQMTPFANDLLHPLPADKSLLRLVKSGWDPNAFVDLVQQVEGQENDPRHHAAVTLQRLEWRLLFDHCMRAATGQ
ncbi:MAG TPA: hypothetical protein VH475_07800 [Tepidisphaeraceae bacterium]